MLVLLLPRLCCAPFAMAARGLGLRPWVVEVTAPEGTARKKVRGRADADRLVAECAAAVERGEDARRLLTA